MARLPDCRATAAPEVKQEPKVPVRSSIKPDYIVCLEDGKRLKMLKRHLMTHYQMTPDQYRQKWGLNSDYPMVAPNYAEQRRTLAKAMPTSQRASAHSRRARPQAGALFAASANFSAASAGRRSASKTRPHHT